MAAKTSKRWVAVRWASGALLLLVPVLAIFLLGSDCLALTAGTGLLDANAFAPQANPKAKAAQTPANGEVRDVHLDVWENTANRLSTQQ